MGPQAPQRDRGCGYALVGLEGSRSDGGKPFPPMSKEAGRGQEALKPTVRGPGQGLLRSQLPLDPGFSLPSFLQPQQSWGLTAPSSPLTTVRPPHHCLGVLQTTDLTISPATLSQGQQGLELDARRCPLPPACRSRVSGSPLHPKQTLRHLRATCSSPISAPDPSACPELPLRKPSLMSKEIQHFFILGPTAFRKSLPI